MHFKGNLSEHPEGRISLYIRIGITVARVFSHVRPLGLQMTSHIHLVSAMAAGTALRGGCGIRRLLRVY